MKTKYEKLELLRQNIGFNLILTNIGVGIINMIFESNVFFCLSSLIG